MISLRNLRFSAIFALLVVSSCAGKERIVPIPIACVKGALPAEPAKVPPLTGNAEADIGPIAAALIRWKAHSRELAAMLEACKG